MKIVEGLLLSYFYIVFVLFFSQNITKSQEVSRKVSHILLGFWWIIVIYFLVDSFFAIIPPLSFAIINYIFLTGKQKNQLLRCILREEKGDVGIILYPVSLIILLLISFVVTNDAFLGGIGVMTLAFGDGFASLIGRKYPLIEFKVGKNTKSVIGCLSMFTASLISLIFYISITKMMEINIKLFFLCILISFIETIVEMVTPSIIDNITVPITTILCYLVLVIY